MSEGLTYSATQERRRELIASALHDALGVINLVSIRYTMGENMPIEELLRQIGADNLDDFNLRMIKADVALKVLIGDVTGEPYYPRFTSGDNSTTEAGVATVEDSGLTGS
jgi:hypothetical protein